MNECPICGEEMVVGENNWTIDGHDRCTGVKRDYRGYAWYPDEEDAMFMDVLTEKVWTESRPDYLEN